MATPTSPRRTLSKPKPPAAKTKEANRPNEKGAENAPTSPESNAKTKLDTAFEKQIGLSAETLQELFTKEPSKDKKGKKDPVEKLKELLRNRCVAMRTFSLRDWRIHAAEDEAYNAAFRQITPTLIGKVFSGDKVYKSQQELETALANWSIPLDSVFTTIYDADGRTVKQRILTKDTFTTVKVPIVPSLVKARSSRIFAERDNEPFMSFEPTRSTEEWQVVGEIITKLVANMNAGFGYKAKYRGANHQRFKYSNCLLFPSESWYVEYDGDGKVVKEGLRYNAGHVTRCAWDQTYPPTSFHSDTGCEWAAYWRLAKYADIDQNPAYYNKDKISYSATNWVTSGPYQTYFEWTYPCQMEFPCVGTAKANSKNREEAADIYTQGDHDKAIFVTDMFMKLSPKEWGLSDYEPKVWIKFVMASDGEVCYAEPHPYCPVLYLGSDADDSTSNSTASFALECIPWQDLVGNVLSDIINAMKQNSIKVIFYDKLQITTDKIEEIIAKAKQSGSAVWFPIDWRDLQRGQVDIDKLFKAFTFPTQNIGEKIATLNTVFNVMERGLGMSAQETGAIAGHTQTRGEIEVIANNQSSRLGLITSMDDDFFDAWKRQILTAIKWFMDEDFAVDVSAVDEKVIKSMKDKFGFEFESIGKERMRVKGKKSKLSVDAFLSTREGRTRQSNPQIAQVMFQALAAISANADLAMRIGPQKLVDMYNRAFSMAGMPEDSKFKLDPEAATMMEAKKVYEAIEQLSKQMLAASKQEATSVAQKVTQDAGEQVVKEVAPALQQVGESAAQAGQAAAEAQQGVKQVAAQSQQGDQQIAEVLAQQNQDIQALGQQLGTLIQKLERMFAGAGAPPMVPSDTGMIVGQA